ncbi:Phosphopantetheine attachment site [Yersinia intermedia]|uniref:acyl carrier protein n=1 Tax=Yersinia intermedia TaxID=631 RepID=UPI0005DB8FFD|nr:acyl carrier protein [Yersinia intermedia]CQJ56229.1 Phosphopantetheine attachment site [Yersinia intermedia]
MTTTPLEKLCEEVAKILKTDNVDADCPLGQLGIDSLNVVELILACQMIYPNVMDFDDLIFDENSTLREIDACMMESSLQV